MPGPRGSDLRGSRRRTAPSSRSARLALLETDAARRCVDVVTTFAGNAPEILADHVQLQQLMLNALEALDPIVDRRKQVSVRTRRDERRCVVVEVADNGVGLDD